MFDVNDLFQWERFITPQIIKIFYWLAVAVAVLTGVAGVGSGLMTMAASSLIGGFIAVITSLLLMIMGVIFARIGAEFILIVFRISEHLGAIRNRGEGM